MLGDENGHVPLTMEKEIYPTENTKGILGSDDFNGEKLSLYWQWNHNPVDDKWSLTERPGYLRLETSRVLIICILLRIQLRSVWRDRNVRYCLA